MRILHLTDRLSERGGAYRHLLGLLEAQAEEHTVHLAHGVSDGAAAPCPSTTVSGLEARERRAVTLEPLVRSFRPDVVHVHTVVNPAVLEWAGERRSVITVQDHRYFCPTRGKWTAQGERCREPMGEEACAGCFEDEPYFRQVFALTGERLLALRRLEVVVLSAYMRRELAAVGLDEGRMHVVPPFVHGLDPGADADGPPCVLFAGRLAATKGVAEAIDAWRRSEVRLPLVFAGTGPWRAEVERRGFEALGWLDRARLSAAYRRARVLLMPPRWQEPFGLAGLEALAMGVPVVAWDSGGIREWHPGPGLVAWGDVDGLSRALREAVGRRAEAAPGFERGPLMRRLLDVYARVAAPRA